MITGNTSDTDNNVILPTTPKSNNHTSFVPIGPPIPLKVELGLTITYTVLYSFLFVFIYSQLCMILYYKYKRLSYQSIFLFLCLLWAALRTLLFSFYFKNVNEANTLPVIFYWLLYSFPVCLQFVILCLMVLYFSQLYIKILYRQEPKKYRKLIRSVVFVAVLIFFTTNIVCAFVSRYEENTVKNKLSKLSMYRVIISQMLFMSGVISLSVFIIKLSRCSHSKHLLEAKGISVCQAVSACVCLNLLFASRVAYNLIVVIIRSTNMVHANQAPTFDFSWINVSDQADSSNVQGRIYVTFGVVLFLWEFLPTAVVVLLYRVRQPPSAPVTLLETSSHSYSSKVYFFDNPRRYDSDEDLSPSINSTYGTEVMRHECNGNCIFCTSRSNSISYPGSRSIPARGSSYLSSSSYSQSLHSHSVPKSIK